MKLTWLGANSLNPMDFLKEVPPSFADSAQKPGDEFGGLAAHYKLGASIVRKIIRDVCIAINEIVGPIALPQQLDEDVWKEGANGFYERWDFPYCCGAVDGKHIDLQKPRNTGSMVPYMLVGDAASPLLPNLMKPYPAANRTMAQRIFDYRLSRSRRVVENAFGLLATKWRVLRKPITAEPPFATKIVHALRRLKNGMSSDAEYEHRLPFSSTHSVLIVIVVVFFCILMYYMEE
uniref:DDE Tnp4 domain-containing protein n=1 Tax=Plectus sambesii TaxID=2011161 RepID=A0A914WGU5_9BILA